MQLDEGKRKFIDSWGNLGINWGVNRTMGQVHALLLVAHRPLCADEVMKELKISRGNANMTLRALIDWGLVHKKFQPGERKEYFVSEKDVWTVFKNIIQKRKQRELEPMLKVLDDIVEVQPNCPASDEFCKMIKELHFYSHKADQAFTNITKMDQNWFVGSFMKMMR